MNEEATVIRTAVPRRTLRSIEASVETTAEGNRNLITLVFGSGTPDADEEATTMSRTYGVDSRGQYCFRADDLEGASTREHVSGLLERQGKSLDSADLYFFKQHMGLSAPQKDSAANDTDE